MAEVDMRCKAREMLHLTQKLREDSELIFSRLKNQEESLRDIYTFSLFGYGGGGILDAFCEMILKIENKSFIWKVDRVSYMYDGRSIMENRGYLIDCDLYSKYPHFRNRELKSADVKTLSEEKDQFISIFERVFGLECGDVKDYWGEDHDYIRGIPASPYLINFGRNNEVRACDHGEGQGVFSSISNERYDYLLSFVDYCVDWRLKNLNDVCEETLSMKDYIWPRDLSPLVKSYTKNYNAKK